jgi:hypothetical protein
MIRKAAAGPSRLRNSGKIIVVFSDEDIFGRFPVPISESF